MQEDNIQAKDSHMADGQERENIFMVRTPLEKLTQVPGNTLDEGQCVSLCGEMNSMCYKFSYVLLPRSDDNSYKLRNWDLWGPFFMCIIYGLFINNSSQFLVLFFSVFVGAIIVTFNVKVLGGDISFFQSVAVLGYCIFPLFMAMLILKVLIFLQIQNQLINMFLIIGAIIWAIVSCRAFIAVNVPDNRKLVAVFPISLFYIFIGIMLIYN